MAKQKPGGIGEYFEGAFNDPGRVIKKTMYASTCAHCGYITEFPSMRTMTDHVEVCRCCMGLICLNCYGKPCRPLEKEVERVEAEQALRNRLERNRWGCY